MTSARKRKRWVIVSLLAVAFVATYLGALAGFRTMSSLDLRSADDVPPSSDHVVVQLDILEIDPVLQKVWLRLIPDPAGGLREGDRPVPARALTLGVEGARVSLGNALTEGRTETSYAAGQNVTPVDAVTILTNGSVGDFPFDVYLFDLRLRVTTPDPDAPSGYRSLPVIIKPAPNAGLPGYALSAEVSQLASAEGAAGDAVELSATVQRSPAAFWYTILLMSIAAALALACATVAVAIALDPRLMQPAFFGWMSATLFAIVGLRRVLPGNPPFGSLPDLLVFMWAEILVALALVDLVVVYLHRKPQS